MAGIVAFDLEEKKAYEREMLRRRFEALLKTVAEDNDIDLSLTREVGASTDGYRAKITDPFTFFDLGYKTSDAITIALHCTIHEASHILYSGKPVDTLNPAYKKYVPEGYRWKDLFWCIDAMEDWRVNHLMEEVRPGIIKYRTKASKLMIDMNTGTEDIIYIRKALMKKYFSESKKWDADVYDDIEDKVKKAVAIWDRCNAEAKTFNDVVKYAVQMYDVLHDKRAPGEPEETKLRKKKKPKPESSKGEPGSGGSAGSAGDDDDGDGGGIGRGGFSRPEDVPSFMSGAEDDDEDLTVPEEDEDTEGVKDDEDLVIEDEEGEEKELDLEAKPAMMGDSLDKGLESLEKREKAIAALEGDSPKFGGTAYMYPVAPIKGAKIIAQMVKEGQHIDTPVCYVKLPEDKMHKLGGHKSWLTYLHSAPVENRVRTFIGKAKNVLKLDNKGIVEQRKSGRPISTRLWRASCDIRDTKVFSKKIDLSQGDTAVYILADNSGSMRGIIDVTREAVYMLARLMIHYNIPCKVVIFDCATELSKSCVRHVELKDWEEKTADGIARYSCGHDNRDGLSVHIASLELAQRTESNKILFVLSDGEPADGTSTRTGKYTSYSDCTDVAQYVRKARCLGIQVLGVYMTNPTIGMSGETLKYRARHHKEMYGDELYTIGQLEQIPSLLLRALSRFTTH